eukprot:TRINITY_DN23428_c0_g1_i1.p1 TRINITY_DN23428_c0_g1~~TRINITY_DN23428_c0_g1_i1.p1  ORF type:complete len:261 (+),score=46.67 TRINITY_DN23428_c0_g1_i1:38-784(+)
MNAIIYVMLQCKGIPVADYSPYAGTMKVYCNSLIPVFQNNTYSRTTYKIENAPAFAFHVLLSNDKLSQFVCVTHQTNVNQAQTDFTKIAFTLLTELRLHFEDEIKKTFASKMNSPLPYEMKKVFEKTIVKIVNRYNSAKEQGFVPDSHEVSAPDTDDTIVLLLLSPQMIKIKTPLLVQSTHLLSKQRPRVTGNESWIKSRMQRHPYLMIGLCIFVGVLLLLYFVVVIPLCGAEFEVRDEEGKRLCWFY